MSRYDGLLYQKRLMYPADAEHPFDDSDLAPQFRQAYDLAPTRRIKVSFRCASEPSRELHTMWGYVSVTSGWKPTFLLMRRLGQVGSSDTLRACDVIVDAKDKR